MVDSQSVNLDGSRMATSQLLSLILGDNCASKMYESVPKLHTRKGIWAIEEAPSNPAVHAPATAHHSSSVSRSTWLRALPPENPALTRPHRWARRSAGTAPTRAADHPKTVIPTRAKLVAHVLPTCLYPRARSASPQACWAASSRRSASISQYLQYLEADLRSHVAIHVVLRTMSCDLTPLDRAVAISECAPLTRKLACTRTRECTGRLLHSLLERTPPASCEACSRKS